MHCNTCFHYSAQSEKKGICNGDHLIVDPNYYTFNEDKMQENGAHSTYSLIVGPKFGCIHHESILSNEKRVLDEIQNMTNENT